MATEVRLQELYVENFKGFRGQHEFEFNGQSVEVRGANETGKSSLFDAFTYLLFDRDHEGSHDFALKTRDQNENVIPDLDHSVEATLTVDKDGETREVTLTKNYVEKRNDNDQVTGHSTKCYINGAKINKSEFEREVAGIIDEDQFSLITDPTYFAKQLHWKERREMLLDMVEEPTPAEIVEQKPTLEDYHRALQDRGFTETGKFESFLKQQTKELEEQLEDIPSRLEELRNQLPEDLPDLAELKEKKTTLKQEREQLQEKISQAKAGGQKAELKNQLNEVRADMQEIKQDHENTHRSKQKECQAQLDEARRKKEDLERKLKNTKKDVRAAVEQTTDLEDELGRLRQKYDQLAEQQMEAGSEAQVVECPTCGQQVEGEKAEEIRGQFNLGKSNQLEEINKKGKRKKQKLEQKEEDLAELRDKKKNLEDKIEQVNEEIDAAELNLESLQPPSETLQNDDGYQKLQSKEESLEAKIEDAEEPDLAEEKQKLEELDESLEAVETKIAKVNSAKQTQDRIEELEQKRADLAAKLENFERLQHLAGEWTKAKMQLIEGKVNNYFEITNWTLFERQMNGKIKDVCYPTNKGTPASDFSTSQAIKVGLDIIQTLNRECQVWAPVFIDRAESISELPSVEPQTISLVVDPLANELTIEPIGEQSKQKELV